MGDGELEEADDDEEADEVINPLTFLEAAFAQDSCWLALAIRLCSHAKCCAVRPCERAAKQRRALCLSRGQSFGALPEKHARRGEAHRGTGVRVRARGWAAMLTLLDTARHDPPKFARPKSVGHPVAAGHVPYDLARGSLLEGGGGQKESGGEGVTV